MATRTKKAKAADVAAVVQEQVTIVVAAKERMACAAINAVVDQMRSYACGSKCGCKGTCVKAGKLVVGCECPTPAHPCPWDKKRGHDLACNCCPACTAACEELG